MTGGPIRNHLPNKEVNSRANYWIPAQDNANGEVCSQFNGGIVAEAEDQGH